MIASVLALSFAFQNPTLSEIAAKYHLEVEEVQQPLDWKGDHYEVKANPATAAQLEAYVPLFAKEWTLYPPSFVAKAEVHRLVFGADLSMNGQTRAAVPAFDGDTMYYDPALGAFNPHYQRVVIHHEFFHMVDQRMKLLATDPEWSRLNPAGFHYGNGGDKMRQKGVGELTGTIPGFLTRYGTSAVEEDKAELFAHMVVDGPYVKELAAHDSVLQAKIDLLRSRLAAFDPAMGSGFWKSIPGWEKAGSRIAR